MYKFTFPVLLLLTVLLFSGCKDSPTMPETPLTQAAKGVYVLNEGLYSQNNSTLSYYELTSRQVLLNVFAVANGGRSLGDTGNDLVIVGNTAFIAVNVSNKIEVVDITNFKSKGTIDLGAGSGPRRIFAKDSLTAYVSGFSGKVYKIDAKTMTVVKEITVGSYPEGMVEVGGRLFVANSGLGGGNTVSVIDLNTDAVLQSITVGTNPVNLAKDKNNILYSICTGRYDSADIGGAIYKIDPVGLDVLDSLILPQNPSDAVVTSENIMLVLNNFGVMKVDLGNFKKTPELFIGGMAVNSMYGMIYSIAYDPIDMLLYLGNPKDFTQNGEVAIFDMLGKEVRRFEAGLNPGSLAIVNYR
ncbi:MAG: YncE family protein [Ignavibacteriaceae bacterium]|jgi:YVTN family beta-propeller protein|nr:YncE family protein [Ignavibacteriaceae bacterium]